MAGKLRLAGGRTVILRRFPEGAIVDSRPGHPLLAAFAASETPTERRIVRGSDEVRAVYRELNRQRAYVRSR